MKYHHTQFGAVIIYGMLLPFVSVLVLPLFIQGFPPVFLPALAVLSIVFLLFYSLSVDVADGVLTCSFGIGLIRRRILLSDVQQVRTVTNSWIVGWGIRWVPGQYWLWNVSGFQAVELLFENRGRFRIGTDEPEALANAIQSSLGSAA